MSSMVIFIILINILAFNCEVANPGSYSGAEFIFAVLACALVGVMHHYAKDRDNNTYTSNLWGADGAGLLFSLLIGGGRGHVIEP